MLIWSVNKVSSKCNNGVLQASRASLIDHRLHVIKSPAETPEMQNFLEFDKAKVLRAAETEKHDAVPF